MTTEKVKALVQYRLEQADETETSLASAEKFVAEVKSVISKIL